ncbi:MAG: KTSC domain-containing protein [Verrucomicrobia bacterium]|nr:KTSC domain-containing protein [Verrucomicrobiota bacterium]
MSTLAFSGMIPVVSSNIAEIGHDFWSGTLTVAFHNGSIYEYDDVPRSVFHDFLDADSKGGFHAREIRGHYSYRRIY